MFEGIRCNEWVGLDLSLQACVVKLQVTNGQYH